MIMMIVDQLYEYMPFSCVIKGTTQVWFLYMYRWEFGSGPIYISFFKKK